MSELSLMDIIELVHRRHLDEVPTKTEFGEIVRLGTEEEIEAAVQKMKEAGGYENLED